MAERGEIVLDEELGHAHPLLAGDAVRHAALPIVCPPASRQSASLPARAPAQHVQSAELEFERSPLMKFQTRVLSGARPVMKLLRLAEQIPKFVSAQTPPGVRRQQRVWQGCTPSIAQRRRRARESLRGKGKAHRRSRR